MSQINRKLKKTHTHTERLLSFINYKLSNNKLKPKQLKLILF